MIKLKTLHEVAPKYFIKFDNQKCINFHRFHLGEDQYMTFLLTKLTTGLHQVAFVSSATCKTDAPDGFRKLLKQRRRWMLGALPNDVLMIFSRFMWKKFPILTFLRGYMHCSGGTGFSLYVFILFAATGLKFSPLLVFTFGAIALKYVILFIQSYFMTRTKVFICSLLVYFVSPIFSIVVTMYSVWTWELRSWGGPRTDENESSQLSQVKIFKEGIEYKDDQVGRTRRSLWQIINTGRYIGNAIDVNNNINKSVTGSVAKGNFYFYPLIE